MQLKNIDPNANSNTHFKTGISYYENIKFFYYNLKMATANNDLYLITTTNVFSDFFNGVHK